MPYLVTNREGLARIKEVPKNGAFQCGKCGSKAFMRDSFNPYYTSPDRAGYYHEWLLLKCGHCGQLHSINMVCHIDDGPYPGHIRPDAPNGAA